MINTFNWIRLIRIHEIAKYISNFHLIDGSSIYKIVKMIMERNFAPVIIFSFSKKDCENYAVAMTKLDFNTGNPF